METLTRDEFRAWLDPPLWGVVHLASLPGSPGYEGDPDRPLRRALEDTASLYEAGFRGVVIENFGDAPFYPDHVPAITVASMTRITSTVRDRYPDLRIAVNCLRNDAASALAVAVACGGEAIRINVHSGATLTDQGIVEGRAHETLRLREAWGGREVRILADVAVKHAAPLAERSIEDEAADLRDRGLADALLLTGSGTGRPADPSIVARLRAAVPSAPLLVASGVSSESAAEWASLVDGAIVGSDLMHGGRAGAGIDPQRARRFVAAWTRAAQS